MFDAEQVAALRAPGNGSGTESSISMRLARLLRAAIVDGKLKTGEGLPPERDLAERFQVSRDTVRRAIEKLTRQGLIESRRGAGAAPARSSSRGSSSSFRRSPVSRTTCSGAASSRVRSGCAASSTGRRPTNCSRSGSRRTRA
ncbi:winged helix-turn-helix domain-containing protein [Burkholderia ubonensis]|uniref:winged helix-turn-helix domain-containing protein n=1 Tax=Burkholderia ubonensis TaxID=101571 RepID=UPI00358EF583